MFTLCSVLLGGGGVGVQKGAASKTSSPIATGNELTQKYPELGLSTPRLFMQFIRSLAVERQHFYKFDPDIVNATNVGRT